MTIKNKFWLAGLLLAALGVAIARLVSPYFTQPVAVLVLYGVGILLAFAGLGLIMYGMKKNARKG